GEALSREESELHEQSAALYQRRLELGVAREQARKDLPLCTYTEAYWKVDLHNLLHFLALRMDSHAQEEIRAFATIIGEKIVAPWVPFTWEAFVDYRLKSKALTRLDSEVIQALNSGGKEAATAAARDLGILAEGSKGLKRNRERDELEAKLEWLGLEVPWKG
ncbi:MAG: FAD-dependent thymidylate synthase, partial [Deltaproteobacteria bacterium]|nr:FAD-dependent thymidylate synthase [Deltaproteobacteria bacterium]